MVIDEASMMTPVTLARIDLHLRLSLESDLSFGGLRLLLIGDFFQFPRTENIKTSRDLPFEFHVSNGVNSAYLEVTVKCN